MKIYLYFCYMVSFIESSNNLFYCSFWYWNLCVFVCIVSFLFVVGSAVKITSFVVPSSYVIEDEENPGQLVLDCAYESEPNEKGIVVKWWLNDSAIYQWIPKEPAPPRTFVSIQLHYSKRFNFNMNDTQKKNTCTKIHIAAKSPSVFKKVAFDYMLLCTWKLHVPGSDIGFHIEIYRFLCWCIFEC